MNLDDLMAVWRSQDAAPLHDVNKTLLHLALRQDDAKLQKHRRRERWLLYVVSAGIVAGMTIFLWMMLYFRGHRPEKVVSSWDLAVPVIGAAAALLVVGAIYVTHRNQARREQSFGASLRDQLCRRIAQLEGAATRVHRASVLVLVVMGGVCPTAILILGMRVNDKSFSDDGYMIVSMILVCVGCVVVGVRQLRHAVQNEIVPRKARLEALLKELDGQ